MDIEKMIADAEAKKKDNEIICFAIGAGRIVPKIGMKKQQKAAMLEIMKQDGFMGFNPVDLWHTLLIFDTLNNAKAARNVLTSKGIQLGQVVPVLVPVKGGEDVNR